MTADWHNFRYFMQMGPRSRRDRVEWLRQWLTPECLREACEIARLKLSRPTPLRRKKVRNNESQITSTPA
mgnify:CR=1 FL=1